jgi:hypothetical protein
VACSQNTSIAPMTGSAGVVESVASHAGALIEHRQAGVGSVLEQGEWNVSSGQLIVTAATIVGNVAGGANRAIESGVAAVDIVLPARSVRGRLHHLMAGRAAIACNCIGGNVAVTGEALGARRGGLFPMLHAKGFIVRGRFHVVVVARRENARPMVLMAESAVRHAEPVRQAMAGFVATHAIEHLGQL